MFLSSIINVVSISHIMNAISDKRDSIKQDRKYCDPIGAPQHKSLGGYINEYNNEDNAAIRFGFQADAKGLYEPVIASNRLDHLCVYCKSPVYVNEGENCINIHCENMIQFGRLFAHKRCMYQIIFKQLLICKHCWTIACAVGYKSKRIMFTNDLSQITDDLVIVDIWNTYCMLWNNPQAIDQMEICVAVPEQTAIEYGYGDAIKEYKIRYNLTTRKMKYNLNELTIHGRPGALLYKETDIGYNLNLLHIKHLHTSD
eukprot:866756_1